MNEKITDSKLLILGLVAEKSRHAYEIEQALETRGMREWTEIGFSSIYFVLGELEKKKLVKSQKPKSIKGKKVFSLTKKGENVLKDQTTSLISNFRKSNSSLFTGMTNWGLLTEEDAISALKDRVQSIKIEILRLEESRYNNQPLPDYVELLFNFSIKQLENEFSWVLETIEYMSKKP